MCKRIILQLVLLLICTIAPAQNRKANYTLDPYGKKTSPYFINLTEKYPENSMAFRITSDSGRVYQFNAPRYSGYKVDIAYFRKRLEELTGKAYSDSAIFIIHYNYKDDSCFDRFSNKMSSSLINKRKEYYDTHKSFIEKTFRNTVLLILFENGISLSNKPDSKNEYFFSDKDSYVRNTIFRNPTVCGSFSIVKHDGNTLVYNGENRPDSIAEHLNPEIWNSIFKIQ